MKTGDHVVPKDGEDLPPVECRACAAKVLERSRPAVVPASFWGRVRRADDRWRAGR
jgi:hypothetical protein